MLLREIDEPAAMAAYGVPDRGFIADSDARLLLWLSSRVRGDILEIGCNTGRTTRMLAQAHPNKRVYGVDFNGATTIASEQQSEVPGGQIGACAAGLPNVSIFNQSSFEFIYPEGVRFIFIDGDHSYRGVKTDSDRALAHAATHMLNNGPVIIVWHDFHDMNPQWCKVKAYLLGELSLRYSLEHVRGTNCVHLIL